MVDFADGDEPITEVEEGPEMGLSTAALERNNALLVVFGTLATLYWKDRNLTLSFLAGGLLTVLNLHLLRRIVAALVSPETVSYRKIVAQVLMKLLVGMGALALLLIYFKVKPIPLLLGLSTVVLTIFFEGLRGLFRRT